MRAATQALLECEVLPLSTIDASVGVCRGASSSWRHHGGSVVVQISKRRATSSSRVAFVPLAGLAMSQPRPTRDGR